jgi:hypothetical protein
MSVISLVMDVLNVDVAQAIRWLAERFDIPLIPKGKHLNEPHRPRGAVGNENPVELLVRSRIWAILSPPAQRIFPVLLSFAQKDDKRRYMVEMSYLAIQRYSGLKSPNAVKGALACLRDYHLLEGIPVHGGTPPLRPTGKYYLTPYGDEFQELANAVSAEQRTAIEIEREFRKQARSERCKKTENREGSPKR